MKCKSYSKYILLCLAGIAVNFVGALLATELKLPLYLDAIGTVATAAIGGLLPGITVGFLTNIITSITDSSNLFFAFVNVMLAVLAAFYSVRGYFKKPDKLPVVIVALSLCGALCGTALIWSMNGGEIGEGMSSMLARALVEHGVPGVLFPLFVAELAFNFLDKTVTVLAVVLILKLLPERVIALFRRTQEETELTRNSANSNSLRRKVLIVISVIAVVIMTVVSLAFMSFYRAAIINKETKIAYGVANAAVSNFDPDQVNEYLSMEVTNPEYASIRMRIGALADSSEDIAYVYAYKILEDGCHVVFDPDTIESPGSGPGEVIPFDPSFMPVVPDLLAGKPIDPIISNDRYGWLLTIYQPVYDTKGTCQCYVGVDISMNYLVGDEQVFLVKVVSLFLGFLILIFCYVAWLADRWIISPINRMAGATSAFATGLVGSREDSVRRIRELRINSGDEMEELYHSIESTTDEISRYIADLETKNNQISQMQQTLIMVLADLVESRDQCTGDHVRNTARYVQMILDQLKEDGVYAEQLTDDYMRDTVSGAPLHDVGKIQVPDSILNKPGKLTAEEFDIMKTHAAAGGKIIDEAIRMMDEGTGSYLQEARNVALYHHERWDGTGYPTGLAGEDIPLSARVMAVADVFDALISRRSYKEGFPFEKAIAIIQEESGSHFDPKVVNAFLKRREQAREISVVTGEKDRG